MKIVNFSPMPTFPPRFGGQIRIYSLNKELSKRHEIIQFSKVLGRYKNNENKLALRSWERQINNNYREYNFIYLPSLLLSSFLYLLRSNSNVLSSPMLNILNPKIVEKEISNCDLIQVEFPYLFDYAYRQAKKAQRKIPIILSEHNVEYQLERALSRIHPSRRILLSRIKKAEELAVRNADAIFVVSDDDAIDLQTIYDADDKIEVIPNGVDISKFKIIPQDEKIKIKEEFNLSEKRIVLFSGSIYPPNVEAVKLIRDIATQVEIEDVIFLIAGSVGEGLKNTENMIFTGYVDDITPYFKMADIAVNPLESGSGTNLKMLEYLASGLPTITTKMGTRGLQVKQSKHVIIADIEDFPDEIINLLTNKTLCKKLAKNGRELAEKEYSWQKIADKALKKLETLV